MPLWQHFWPASSAGLSLEWTFFNAEQLDMFHYDPHGSRLARRSKASLSQVRAGVTFVVENFGLADLSKPPRKKWRDALRAIYVKHFGDSSQQRNNISLCLLVRPRDPNVSPCRIFQERGAANMRINGRAGVLCLGDLRIDQATLAQMTSHFGLVRWSSIACVQVPHHGSRHSWEQGAAPTFAPDRFVHCVPDTSTHHPHQLVSDDLASFCVTSANYQRRV